MMKHHGLVGLCFCDMNKESGWLMSFQFKWNICLVATRKVG